MKRGLAPIKFKDYRTFDFHRTFGTTQTAPAEFNFDTSGIFPDQNNDDLPQACTAYTVNDVASNEDKTYYNDQDFTYKNTKRILGVSGEVPVDLMTAMKAGIVYGVKKKVESAQDAPKHRRGPYFIVKKNTDYFDGLTSAMWIKQGALLLGTPWLQIFETISKDGVIPNFIAPTSFLTGHAWSAEGIKIINGEPRIICKSWQGPSFGDHGYCYFNRKQINDLLGVKGSGAFGQKDATSSDIQTVKMSLIETIISYIRMQIDKLMNTPVIQAPIVPEVVEPVGSYLIKWARAIESYENFNKASNNPGAIRGADGQFLKFPTYTAGFNYLLDYLTRVATGKHKAYPKGGETTLLEFQRIYSPVADKNDPDRYASVVAKEIGVDANIKIKNLV